MRLQPAPLIGVLLFSFQLSAFSFSQSYTIQPTGSLPDVDPTIPTPPGGSGNGINESGVVAGAWLISGGSIKREPVVVIAEPIIPHPFRSIDGRIEDLGVFGGDVPPEQYPKPQSIAWDLNDLGWIVGDVVPVDDFQYDAWVWLPEPAAGLPAGYTELPWIFQRARAWHISNTAVVAGESQLEGELGIRAVFWTLDDGRWTVHDLGTFGGASSAAYGVNDHGQITGFSFLPSGTSTTFLYLPEPAYGMAAGVHDVTPGLSGDLGNAINDLGQIAGRGQPWLPMLWLPEPADGLPAGATVFSADEVADQEALDLIGAVAMGIAEFAAINNHGDAVGWGDFAMELPNGEFAAFRHGIARIDGEFFVMEELLPEGSGWSWITHAWDINDAGQITGSGVDPEGNFVGYVLTPAGACPADATGDGLVDVDDLVEVVLSWGPCEGDCPADVNRDGVVDVDDLVAVVLSWGPC